MSVLEFIEFPKIARLSRECIITEKIDGTNAQVLIASDGEVLAGSRSRWVTPAADNHGFARWVADHADDLRGLGEGRHFGEWWGQGIQRKYGLQEKRFSLFNVTRWCAADAEPQPIPSGDPTAPVKMQERVPACCHVVPVLWRGLFSTDEADRVLNALAQYGSHASPGFMRPEGIVVFHVAGNVGFKRTIERDGVPKSVPR
jgi:hypothetical protein